MKSSNPVLTKVFDGGNRRGYAAMSGAVLTPENLEETFSAPAASSLRTGRMTMDDVITRTGTLFAIALAVGAFAWYFNLGGGALLLGFVGGIALALFGIFSKKVRPGVYVAYAVAQGLVLGVISKTYELFYDGIVQQAIVATIAAFVGMLFLYRSGRLRATPKFTRLLIGATFGYLILALGSLIGSLMGFGSLFSLSVFGPMLAMVGVALASFFLILDFDQIENGVRAGVPAEQSWRAAFGLLITVVWLYLEILRLLAILRGNNN
jgi:uncharacterized YccA/Bax inhibitor family protein